MNRRVDVRITAPIADTELEDRVTHAVTTVFPSATVERTTEGIVAETHSLEHLADRIREQRIIDTARTVFAESRRGRRFSFSLKKQAALHDRVTFAVGEGDELGVIRVDVRVEVPDAEAYIDTIAPPTDADGRPRNS